MAGKIVELLAKEEDTVTVGADLFRIEAGEGKFLASHPIRDSCAEFEPFSFVVVIRVEERQASGEDRPSTGGNEEERR